MLLAVPGLAMEAFDLDRAMGWSGDSGDVVSSRESRADLERRWGDVLARRLAIDEVGAVEAVRGLPGYSGHPERITPMRAFALSACGSHFAAKGEAQGLAFLRETSKYDKASVARGVFKAIAERSVEHALSVLQSVDDANVRSSGLLAIMVVQARTDRVAAAKLAPSLSSQHLADAGYRIIDQWPMRDADDLVPWITGFPGASDDLKQSFLNHAARRLCDLDPVRAAGPVAGFPIHARLEVVERLARALSKEDLGKSLAWMSNLSTQAERNLALRGVLDMWMDADVEAARKAVLDWPDAAEKLRHIEPIAEALARVDAMRTLGWAKTLPSPLREQAMVGVVYCLRWNDQRLCREEVMALPPGPGRNEAAFGVVNMAAPADRVIADWCLAYPDPETARDMAKSVAQRWYEHASSGTERLEAQAWVMGIKAVAMRDQALSGLYNGASCRRHAEKGDPVREAAFCRRLLGGISDTSLRQSLAHDLYYEWRGDFPESRDDPFREFLSPEDLSVMDKFDARRQPSGR